jgi:hypothetical protein
MPPHLDTPKKCKILGAKEFLDFFKIKADGKGKVGIRKLRGGEEGDLLSQNASEFRDRMSRRS